MSKYILILLLLMAAPVYAAKTETGTITGTGSSDTISCDGGVSVSLYNGTWNSGTITLKFQTLADDTKNATWEEIRVSGTAKAWTADDNDNATLLGTVTYRLDATVSVTSVDYDLRCQVKNY